MNNYANTHCLGENCRSISFMSKECSITLFLSEFSKVTNIPICVGATAYIFVWSGTVV